MAEPVGRPRIDDDESGYIEDFESLIINAAEDVMGAGPDETDEAIENALRRLGEFTGIDRSYLFIVSPESETMTCTHEWCASGISEQRDNLVAIPLSKFPWFMSQMSVGQVVQVPEVSTLPPEADAERKEFEAEDIRSLLCVPIASRGQVRGFLGLDAVYRSKTWNERHIRLLKIMGSMIAGVLERQRAAASLERVKRHSQYLSDVSSLLSSQLDPDEMVERAVDLALKTVGCESAVLSVKDDGNWTIRYSAGVIAPHYGRGRPLTTELMPVFAAAREGTVEHIPDIRLAGALDQKVVETVGGGCLMAVPIKLKSKIVGVLTLHDRELVNEFIEERLDFARKTGNALSLVLQNVRDKGLMRKALSDARALGRVSARLAQSLELDQILDDALDEILGALNIEHGMVYIRHGEQLVVHAQRNLNEAFLRSNGTIEVGEGCAGQAVLTKEMFAPTSSEQEFVCRVSQQLLGLDCLTAVPIISGTRVLGVMDLFAPVHRRLTARERALICAVSGQMAAAIENSNLFATQRNIAETLQETLLTVPEHLSGVELGHKYQASGTGEARTGGDFYDVFELEHGKIGLVVGDVSGKGLEAATVTGFVKNAVKAYSYQFDFPSEVLSMTNRLVEKMTAPDVFVTVFFGVLNKETGELIYCNAGHPPPLVKRASGSISVIRTNSPAIGIFSELEFTDLADKVEPGDMVLLYTDGVTETRFHGELFGTERLGDLLRNIGFASVRDVPRLIVNELMRYAEGHVTDDIAILTMSLAA